MECTLCCHDYNDDERKPLVEMIEKLKELKTSREQKEGELTEVKSKLDEITKEKQHVLSELEEKKEENAELQKKVDQSIAEEERFNESRWTCSGCSAVIEQSRARLCLQCCDSEGIITMDNGVVKIQDQEKADTKIVCASCMLDGEHKGHMSTAYLVCKLQHLAAAEFGQLITDFLADKDGCMTDSLDAAVEAADSLVESLEFMRDHAKSKKCVPDYQEILEICRELGDQFSAVSRTFSGHVTVFTDAVKNLNSEMKRRRREFETGEVILEEPAGGDAIGSP